MIPEEDLIARVERLMTERNDLVARLEVSQRILKAETEEHAATLKKHFQAMRTIREMEVERTELQEAIARATYLAKHLHMMIDQDTWRAQGAEWMGQYEGDHWAEQIHAEIEQLSQLGPPEGKYGDWRDDPGNYGE